MQNAVNTYLRDGTLPGTDITCHADRVAESEPFGGACVRCSLPPISGGWTLELGELRVDDALSPPFSPATVAW
ncbi:hypothetical protein [Amycolatopsis sp. YIM 10]|uniref:hypothetical protein n=1 Tax=Amycolatopsis sp. YIM 10 TaxID=2653857 RepID=UPI003519D8E2